MKTLKIDLPENLESIELHPLADLHLGDSVQFVSKLFVNTAAALNYGGYGDCQNFKPSAKENPVIYLDGKKHEATAKV